MQVEELIKLISRTAAGIDNFTKGAVGFNEYGFIFKDYNSRIPFVTSDGSGKAFGAGSYRYGVEYFRKFYDLENSVERPMDGFIKQFKRLENPKSLEEFYTIDPKYDLLLAGSLKTLVPSITFGGYEEFFDVWMFVKTPKDELFPATFYYGQSGPSIGGWSPKYNFIDVYTHKKVFPQEFEDIINFSPYNFDHYEKHLFLDAMEFALKKVPISDFSAIYENDLAESVMGVEDGVPYIRTIAEHNRKMSIKKKRENNTQKKYFYSRESRRAIDFW